MPASTPTVADWTEGIFVPNSRYIGGIIAQVTINETERDELTITEHPIEQGAPISDHAFKRPSEVVIRAGWSNSGRNGPQDLSASTGVYGYLLSWQVALVPFDLHTGKRIYHNMLISGLTVETDETNEFALMATITCRQVIRVSTSVTQVNNGSGSNNNPAGQASESADHADPSRTAPPVDRGIVQGSSTFDLPANAAPSTDATVNFATGSAF